MSERYIIPNPCTKQKWADMEGNGRARLCRECDTLVHNIEAYSEAEWERLWRESGGKVCGMRGAESPREVRSRRAVLAGALLTAISPLMAQDKRLVIVVQDPTKAVIPGATVKLLDWNNKVAREALSDERGQTVWTDLPTGESNFRVSCLGFKMKTLTVTLTGAGETRVEVTLELGQALMGTTVRERKPWWKFFR